MIKRLRVGAAALNQTPFSWDENKQNIRAAIQRAKDLGVTLLCLPELCVTGYGCEDFFHCDWLHERAITVLQELIPETQGLVVVIGLPLRYQSTLYNCGAVVSDGRLLGFVAKQHLAGDGVHYEPRWFKGWPAGVSVIRDDGIPMGDLIFNIGGVRIGCEICEDAWLQPRPGTSLSRRGVDIICNPSASHFSFGKRRARETYITDSSRSFGCAYIYANLLGCESGRTIYDGDTIIATDGAIIAHGDRFSFQKVELATAVIDLERNRQRHLRRAGVKPLVGKEYTEISDPFEPTKAKIAAKKATPPEASKSLWENISPVPEVFQFEEFTRAIALGLYDYLRKSGHRSTVISLSGGADSTAVSLLVYFMVQRGWGECRETFKKNFALENVTSREEALGKILCCVYQKTANSSPETANAAREVARALSATFYEFDVDHFVNEYVSLVSRETGRTVTWETEDLSLQNVQARARVPGLWLLANIRRALLLSTGNRSESAVGYTTMDGDSSGGLCPIGGIDKPFLRRWLSWIETAGPAGIGPVKAVQSVNKLAPTAELRPLDKLQTDEKDLMPYDVLAFIERLCVRDKKGPSEALTFLKESMGAYHREDDLITWVDRFYHLWSISQWKRERLPVSFHVDDYNVDPRSWCRFPILNGGFRG